MEIIKENGKIWLEEKSESYGVVHTKRIHIGDYDEIEDEKPKKKRKKRRINNKKNLKIIF